MFPDLHLCLHTSLQLSLGDAGTAYVQLMNRPTGSPHLPCLLMHGCLNKRWQCIDLRQKHDWLGGRRIRGRELAMRVITQHEGLWACHSSLCRFPGMYGSPISHFAKLSYACTCKSLHGSGLDPSCKICGVLVGCNMYSSGFKALDAVWSWVISPDAPDQ